MSSNRTVKDEDILSGFASLHQAMSEGFDRVNARMDARFDRVHAEILDVRNDVARLEQRMLQRFDDVDERLARHEFRITKLEARGS